MLSRKNQLARSSSFLFFYCLSGLLIVVGRSHAQVTFYQTPFNQSTAGQVYGGDFNGDGKLDLLSYSFVDFTATVLLGKGDGTFTTGPTVNLPNGTITIGVGDFNNDGKPDILALGSGQVAVFLGNGDGTFQSPVNTYVGLPVVPFVLADFNNDGNLDVVTLTNNFSILVLLGNAKGGFTVGTTQYPTGLSTAGGVVAGDFNGDGKIDVATTGLIIIGSSEVSTVAVLPGNGSGGFGTAITTSVPTIQTLFLLSQSSLYDGVGDFNGDGKLDLVVGASSFVNNTYTFQTFTLLGNGDGTFQQPIDPVSVPSEEIAIADLNGDGKLDMFVDDAQFSEVFLGNGDGSFSAGQVYYDGFYADGNIVIGDFNNDGKPDAEIAGAMLLGNGDGTFQAAPAVLPAGEVAPADFNGDGKEDFAVLTGQLLNPPVLQLLVFLGAGNGQFSLVNTYSSPGSTLSIADVNGDGKPDLILTNIDTTMNTWNLVVMLGQGNGSFGNPIVTNGGSDPYDAAPIIVVGDFNGDGKPDLAAILSGNGVNEVAYIFLGNGDGTFASPVSYASGSGTIDIVTADFNNDKKLDLAVSSQSGLALLLGNGDGTFQQATFITTIPTDAFAAADLTGSGNIDLLADGTVFLGNGDGTFKSISQPNIGFFALVADFNGDGKLDLATTGGNSQSYIILGNGDGTFGNPIVLGQAQKYGLGFGLNATADFNNDGKPDLVAGLGGYGANVSGLAILLNTTTPPAPNFTASASSPSPGTISAGGSATSTVTITPANGFTGMVNLSCLITPVVSPAPTCTVSPQSLSIKVGPATAQVTITSVGPGTAGSVSDLGISPNTGLFGGVAITLGFVFLLCSYRRRPGMALIGMIVLLSTGCGGGGSSSATPPSGGTPAGTYTAAVAAKSGTIGSTVQIVFKVQ